MLRTASTRLVAALLTAAPALAAAQSGQGPAGHWVGSIRVPEREVKVEIDLARNAKGEFAGTFSNPAQRLNGLPLSSVAVEGASLRLVIKGTSGGGTFDGALAADGQSISGNFSTAEGGGYTFPFALTRAGEAHIESAARSAAISREMEGSWSGTMDAEGKVIRIVLTMQNHADGTATGTIMSVDGGGVEVPIALTQSGAKLAFDVKVVNGSWSGALNAEGTELAGTWMQGAATFPLSFRRTAPAKP
jgi:hypothetical protein